jgi:GNAT superfamily N-acetyltransferase
VQEWIDLVASEEAGTEHEDFWRKIMTCEAQAEGRLLYLARLDGQPVGACQLFIANDQGRIDDVYVRPGFRRRGIASAMMIQVITDALTSGCRETYLFTEAGGMAEPLYRKLGFEVRAVNAMRRHIAS